MTEKTIITGAIIIAGSIFFVATVYLYFDLFKKFVLKIFPNEQERKEVVDEIVNFFVAFFGVIIISILVLTGAIN